MDKLIIGKDKVNMNEIFNKINLDSPVTETLSAVKNFANLEEK